MKAKPAAAVAVRVTAVPVTYVAEQVPVIAPFVIVQLMEPDVPAGLPTTVPEPLPDDVTLRVNVGVTIRVTPRVTGLFSATDEERETVAV